LKKTAFGIAASFFAIVFAASCVVLPDTPQTKYNLRYSYGEGYRECAATLDIETTDAPGVCELSVQPDIGERIIIGVFYFDDDKIWKLGDGGAKTLLCSEQDEREYSEYNSETDTGFYERIVWRRGAGLVEYTRGFGAERDLVELSAETQLDWREFS
jgi:hypothetical protein